MSVFDSPIARCDAVREMVLTDETQAECAREHACPAGRICPLCGYFADRPELAEKVTEAPSTH
ncbi:MAG: hypothetical protein IPJ50_21655 [Betaproteobacteria bacterium]|jgi:hypothetical protein|nr:hypothetical protein [Betaproteobacteria bacterium]